MPGMVSEVIRINRRVLTQVASLILKDRLVEEIEYIPGKIIGDEPRNYRCCRHKEKAILRERIKLALGLDISTIDEDIPLAELAARLKTEEEQELTTPYITIIEEACDHCNIDKIVVTNACRNCVAHHCINSCPKNAIKIVDNQAFILRDRCIECGRCVKACSYGAILEIERPCSRVCAVKAIVPGERATASIDYEKCVECGACIVACPFGAISFKSELYKVIKMLQDKESRVLALVAPSYIAQFGVTVDWETMVEGLKGLGFAGVYPVAVGADEVIEKEGEELVARLAAGKGPLLNSCCPSFKNLVQKEFPSIYGQVSQTPSPMLMAARAVKRNPQIKTVFIGPCISKKGEAHREGKGLIDAVVTFEELTALLVAAGINLAEIAKEMVAEQPEIAVEKAEPSLVAMNFCRASGVADALQTGVSQEIKAVNAEGLTACLQLLKRLKADKLEVDFIEGMGCEGGCLGGPGTMVNPRTAQGLLKKICSEKGG